MTRLRWFLIFLARAITERKGRVAVGASAVMISTAIMVCAAGISLGVRQKLGGELRAYGANVIVSKPGGYLDEADMKAITMVGGVEDVSGRLFEPVTIKETRIEAIGMDFAAAAGWKVSGAVPKADGEALMGVNLAHAIKLQLGDSVEIAMGAGKAVARVTGIVERGGPEDNAIMLSLADARRLSGKEGLVSAAFLRVESGGIDQAVGALRAALPASEVRTLKQVANAEASFLGKVELLMALVTAVVLVASGISVSSTMTATVLERIREIGLMRAIGGTRKGVGAFFIAEGAVIGVAGGAAGYLLGYAGAQAVSRGAFGSFISVPVTLLLASMALGVIVSTAAALWPLTDALRRKPSIILRGE